MNDDTESSKYITNPPENVSSGSAIQLPTQQEFPEISKTRFPERPFAQKLGEIEESSMKGFGGEIGRGLTYAAFRQTEQELQDSRRKLEQNDTRITELTTNNAILSTKLALSTQQNANRSNFNWVIGAINGLAAILISVGWADLESNAGKVTILIGGLLFAIGFISPFVLNGKGHRND